MSKYFENLGFRLDSGARSLSFYSTSDINCVDQKMISELKAVSSAHGNRNARLCLHTNSQARFHDMIILEYRTNYSRPHRHLHKEESCHIIEGTLAIIVFDDDGSIRRAILLQPGGCLTSCIGVGLWHMVLPLSEFVVYQEAKQGPFLGSEDSLYPAWAPDGQDRQATMAFMNLLKEQADLAPA